MNGQNNSTWKIDPGHSTIQFRVKHLGIASIVGSFHTFDGSVVCENEDFSGAEITLSIDTNSVATNNQRRDDNLRGEMLLDVVHFPKITFTGILEQADNNYVLAGDLTIRDITKNIRMATELTGTGLGRWDDTRAGFELTGKVNRRDFGIDLEILTGTGNLIIGETINLHIDVEVIKQ